MGSGPIGATFARTLVDKGKKVFLIDLGERHLGLLGRLCLRLRSPGHELLPELPSMAVCVCLQRVRLRLCFTPTGLGA